MGFRSGNYAKVWKFENKGNYSVVELSTSKKNKMTEQYETDFSSKFVRFIGQAHSDIGLLFDGAKIKLGDVETTNSYNKETKQGYTNFLVFSFELADRQDSAPDNKPNPSNVDSSGFMAVTDDIESMLPFQ